MHLDQLLLISDLELRDDDPLLGELEQLRTSVANTLQLPASRRLVRIYLFTNQNEYRSFLARYYPRLPDRRAYFIGAGDQLAVYTFWGDRTAEDLRHELTHAVLHARLAAVPLWLDEGLAEYFETGAAKEWLNVPNLQRAREQLQQGWSPSLHRLEAMNDVANMTRDDYTEAWAWVHFLLHGPPDAERALLDYLAVLEVNPEPGPLEPLLRPSMPDPPAALIAHLRILTQPTP